MKTDRTGIILYTLKYDRCVKFYREILELPVMFRTESLTCFEFGDAYLMVEMDDEHAAVDGIHAAPHRIQTCLRLNVPDVQAMAEMLIANNVAVDYQEHSWGTVAKFFDPDGNLIAFKDSEKFEQQIADYHRS